MSNESEIYFNFTFIERMENSTTVTDPATIVILVVTSVLAPVGLLVNLAVLYLFCVKSDRVIRRRKSFTISLTLADTVMAAGLILSVTHSWVSQSYILSDQRRVVVSSSLSLTFFASATLVFWTLTALITDRFLTVKFPFRQSRRCTGLIICVSIWMIVLVTYVIIWAVTTHAQHIQDRMSIVMMVVYMIMFGVPCILNLVLYAWVHLIATRARLRKDTTTRNQTQRPAATISNRLKKAKRSVLMYLGMSLLSLCGTTVLFVSSYISGISGSNVPPMALHYMTYVALCIAALGTAVNPWLHALRRVRRSLMSQPSLSFTINSATTDLESSHPNVCMNGESINHV